MVATVTTTSRNLSIKVDTPSITSSGILADIDLRQGTPVDDGQWLDGGAAADSYPGAIDGFAAKNTNTTNAAGGMRLVTVKFTLVDAAVCVLGFSAGITKILAIVGNNMEVADKTLSVTFTNTGVEGSATTAPVSTGGTMPSLTLHGEAAGAGQATVLCY